MAALKKRYYQKIDEEVYSAILDNGMSLSIIKKKGFLEKAAFLSTNFGALDNHFYIDGESQSYPAGIAHFLEHKLFEDEQGRDVTLDFVKLGADVNAFTTLDKTTYYFSTLDHFEESLELLLKFTSKFTSSEDSVNHEKRIIEQEINMYQDDPHKLNLDICVPRSSYISEAFIEYLNYDKKTLHSTVSFDDASHPIEVEISFQITDGYQENLISFVNLVKKDDYKVYIYNTHDEESYSNKGFELYNTTPTVKLASYMLKDELNNLGINALVEERPVIKEIKKQGLPYHYSYDISNKYCKEIKEKYPSIIYFIDLHRDGIDKSLSTVTINNKTYAKMMFLLGMKHNNSNKNLEVVTKLNNYLNDNYKGLMRNIYKRNDITYYQYLDSHNFIIEVGGQDNTYQEVYNSIKAFAKALESDLK